jgi:hypothetical protein
MLSIACFLLVPGHVHAQRPEQPQVLEAGRQQGGRVSLRERRGPIPRILDPVEHKKRVYVDEQKRLYVALSAPLFLRLALSPEDDDASYLFHGPTDAQVAMPFYLDGPGRHTITHPAGRKAPGFTTYLYADAGAPVSTVVFNDTPMYMDGSMVYYGKGLQATVQSKDDMTGVMHTYISLNDSIYTTYKTDLSFPEEKSYRLRYYGVDNVGNSEPVAELSFAVDATPPRIDVRFSGTGIQAAGASDQPVYPVNTTLTMEARDGLSGVDRLVYAINSDPEQSFTGPVQFDRPGEYTVVIRAIDRVGNAENQILRFKVQ